VRRWSWFQSQTSQTSQCVLVHLRKYSLFFNSILTLLFEIMQGGKAVIRAPPGGSSCSSGRDKASSLEVLLASSSSSSSSSLSSRASTAAQGGGGGGGGAPAVQAVFVSASVPQPKHFTKQCVQRRWVGADRGTPTFVR
jgi:hypothetical protein